MGNTKKHHRTPSESHGNTVSEDIEMFVQELASSVAYCGLICGLCNHMGEGCIGCRGGGGDRDCYQRDCCRNKGIGGCWDCNSFPCDRGYFADEAWQGLCKGFTQRIRDEGIEKFVSLVQSKLGKAVEYGDLRFKDEKEIVATLYNAKEKRSRT